ncbi:MAG: tetratricopeptide repeat protein [Pseudomonadales bacterium]
MQIRPWLLLVLVLGSVGCTEGPEDARAYYLKAVELEQRDQLDLARVELKNALRLDPTHLDALKLHAKVQEKQRDLPGLLKTLDQIVAVDPADTDAHLRKGELLLLTEDVQEARTHIDRSLKLAPKDIKARNLDIAWLIQTGDMQGALAASNEQFSLGSTNAISHILAITALTQLQLYADAAARLSDALEAYPEEGLLLLMRTRLAHLQGRFSEIPSAYEHLLALHPQEISYWWELARFYVREGQPAEAVSVMRRANQQNPGNERAQYLLAEMLASSDEPDAIAQIESLVQDSDAVSVRFLLAKLYAESDEYAQAVSHYETIMETHESQPAAMSARTELAQIALVRGRKEEAERYVTEVLSVDASHTGAQLVKALMELDDGRARATINRLRSILRDDPDNDQTMALLGRSYLLVGAEDLAKDSFRSSLTTNPLNRNAAKQLALMLRREAEPEQVMEILQPFEHAKVADDDIERELLRARLATGRWKAARRLVERGHIGKDNPTLKGLVNATILQATNRSNESIPILLALTSEHPQSRDVAASLVYAYQQLGRADDAIDFLKSHLKSHPNVRWTDKLLFDTLVTNERYGEAEQIVRAHIEKDEVQADHYGWLSLLATQRGDTDEAVDALEEGTKRYPDVAGLHEDKALLLESQGKLKEAAASYKAALTADATAYLSANNLAVIYSRDPKRLGEARELAERLRDTNDPNFSDTLGWICVLQDDVNTALPLLEFAVSRMPENAEALYHLGVAYRRANQESRGVALLREAEALVESGDQFADAQQLQEELNSLDAS